MSKNTQVGIRIPNDLYNRLETERLQFLERGEKVTMTEIIVKYLYAGLGTSSDASQTNISLLPTLERLTDVLERIEERI